MKSTFGSTPLTTNALLQHGRTVHADSEVVVNDGNVVSRCSFAEIAEGAERLAAALHRLGVQPGDRVATLCWNHRQHLEAYFAIPGMGAVMHTLNLRLFPEQLAWIINHAEDKVIIVDDSLTPLLAKIADSLSTVEHVIVVGEGNGHAAPDALSYAELVSAESPGFAWPSVDEGSAASMCYTSGTTGDPKGVAYSHRSTFLHALGVCSANAYGVNQHDRILLIVPMFHANAWGLPYAGWLAGSDFVMPGPNLQAPHLASLIAEERITFAEGVPTLWVDMLTYADAGDGVDLSSLRMILAGGSAVPISLIKTYQERFGVEMVQAWGMTEMGPLGAIAFPPKGCAAEDEMSYRAKSGRIIAGVEVRAVDESGQEVPWDGTSVGELESRGPWVTESYYRDAGADRFDDGWLRTGDVGTIDSRGFVQLTDRAKDVIKSGGEWISTVELETRLMAHPDVLEAVVIGVPDDRWQERPLACVVRAEGSSVSCEDLRFFLKGQVADWWLPERWAFISEVPVTSVGKFDKKVLRARNADGLLPVETLPGRS
jgi:fatty-acyl-CoA synthase